MSQYIFILIFERKYSEAIYAPWLRMAVGSGEKRLDLRQGAIAASEFQVWLVNDKQIGPASRLGRRPDIPMRD